jgi:alcohol dehydrogenase class IV
MQSANWNYPTSIRFGTGRLRELPQACAELAITRPLLVTDQGLAGTALIARARELCPCAMLFADVQPNPTGENVAAGVAAYRQAECDGVIAFGGGSSLDAGKAIALMVGQDRPLWDFEDVGDNFRRVNEAGMAPVVAVPTTSGTGSEVGRVSVITDAAARVKRLIFHPKIVPGRVIADPELTVGMPPKLTAAVGMDALAHCLEAYCSPTFHPMADGIALEGLRLIERSLLRAFADGGDLQARGEMLAAALMGATAFQKGLGAIHSLSHPLGAHFQVHHGLLNGVVMPYVLAWNGAAVRERLASAAAYMGIADVSAWILELRRKLEIPHTLAELGLERQAVLALAPEANADPSAATNPIPLDEASHRELYARCFDGTLA